MRIERLNVEDVVRAGGPAGVVGRLRELAPTPPALVAQVREIVRDVAAQGDEAVLAYTRTHDTDGADPRPLIVSPQELDDALTQMPMDVVAGLQVAIANVAEVAQAGVGHDVSVDLPQGQNVSLRELPVSSAAVYVPGGRAPYPSTAVMGVVTARAAGVLDVVVCSPPGPGGQIDPAVLGACRLLGVQRVYRMGGAQAIAALAYGTESVDRVDVIVGPGNLWVQEAKREVSAMVGIDGFAGPSDLMVVLGADVGESGVGARSGTGAGSGMGARSGTGAGSGVAGKSEVDFAALDMLAQAEHGAASLVVAVSSSSEVLDRLDGCLRACARMRACNYVETRADVETEAGIEVGAADVETGEDGGDEEVEGDLAEADLAPFVLVEVSDGRAGIELANAFAPEHLQLMGADVERLSHLVRNAGCLLVGPSSATAFGDYVAGSNHILPTAGAARFSSGLSAAHFRRRMSVVRIDPGGACKLARAGAPIARAEGFEWHARSMEARAEPGDTPGAVPGDA